MPRVLDAATAACRALPRFASPRLLFLRHGRAAACRPSLAARPRKNYYEKENAMKQRHTESVEKTVGSRQFRNKSRRIEDNQVWSRNYAGERRTLHLSPLLNSEAVACRSSMTSVARV